MPTEITTIWKVAPTFAGFRICADHAQVFWTADSWKASLCERARLQHAEVEISWTPQRRGYPRLDEVRLK